MKNSVEISKFLSYVLRHKPEAIGLKLDTEGWANISDLVRGAQQVGQTLNEEIIRVVVENSEKQRFTMSGDGKRIRAAQGHTTGAVAIDHKRVVPPAILYHGTATRFETSIMQEGLRPGQRHHVHLSDNFDTAESVGLRYGKPLVLSVAAARMHDQGFAFYQADNGVWLTALVPTTFLTRARP